MTIRFPQPSLCDKLLKLLGKKRGVRIPTGAYEKFGHHAYIIAQKESLWTALRRPGHEELPEEMMDVFLLERLRDTDPEDR